MAETATITSQADIPDQWATGNAAISDALHRSAVAVNAPIGGYTYLPRPGYSDHGDRYISTRSPEHAARMARADALAAQRAA